MAAKLKCTECKAVLTLAKAPAPGKKVRCPKCQETFTVPEEDELDEEEAAPRKKSAKIANPAIKKPEPAKAAAPKQAAAAPSKPPMTKEEKEEEESKGAYTFLDTGETEEERQKNEPKIDYAPDLTVKDPRGAAVATLATLSTIVLSYGGIIGLAGVMTGLIGVWPFMFSETVANPTTARNVSLALEKSIRTEKQQRNLKGAVMGQGKTVTEKFKDKILAEDDPDDLAKLVDPLIRKAERSEDYTEVVTLENMEKEDKVAFKIWKLMEERATTLHTWLIVVSIPILIYGVVMGYGAVKMQTLESHTWGVVASIMGIVFALGAIGLGIYLLTSVEEDAGILDYLIAMFLILANIGAAAGCAIALKTVFDEKIKLAFAYDPEEEERKEKERKERGEDGEDDDEDDDDEEDDE